MEKNKEIFISLHKAKEVKPENEQSKQEENELAGVRSVYRKLEYAHSVALSALCVSARLLAVCELNEDVSGQLSNDPDCSDLKDKITHALCALSEISPQEKERIRMAMYNASVLFDPGNLHRFPEELVE